MWLPVVALTAFLTMLDNTVVTAAAPSIAGDLHASLTALEWVANGYILAFAGLMLPGGRLADRYGRRRVLVIGLVGFAATSLAAGCARDAAVLIAARTAQGVSAALVVPAALAVVAALSARDRLRGVAVWTAAGAIALALGPVVGGALGQHVHWSWIFLLNVPAALAAALCCSGVPEGPRTVHTAVAGALRRARELLAERTFTGGVTIQMLWGLGVNGVYFHTAFYLQHTRGFSPTAAGLAFVPLAVAVAAGAPLAPRLTEWAGPARTVASGLFVVAAGMVAVALVGGSTAGLLTALVVIGFGSALTVPLGAYVLGAVPERRAGVAGGVFSVAREASGVLGIAGIGAVIGVLGDFTRGYLTGLLGAAALVSSGAVLGLRTLPRRQAGAAHRADNAQPAP